MTFLRYFALVALAVWIGGLAALGGVGAPAAFDVMAVSDPVHGREVAGQLFGTMLLRFQYVAWGAAVVLIASLALRAALGPRPRRTAIRIWTVVAMVAISLFTVFVIFPEIDAIRATVDGSVAALPEGDARRIAFGQWHAMSTGLMLLTAVLGLGLMWAEGRDVH